jgi:hypothetical protein
MNQRQILAQRNLEKAVMDHVDAYRESSDGEVDHGVVIDFVVVAQTDTPREDGDDLVAYYLAYSTGSMPNHRAVGLLEWGKHLMMNGAAS